MHKVFLVATLLAAAACRPAEDRTEANEALARGTPAQSEVTTLPPDESVATPSADLGSGATEAGSEVAPTTAAIPTQYHGRWGLVPGDCEPGRSDAKGLLTIGDRTLRFYESVGTLKEQRSAIATSFSGLFAFTGEGMNWEKVVTLTRDGDRLTRAEEEGTFIYTQC